MNIAMNETDIKQVEYYFSHARAGARVTIADPVTPVMHCAINYDVTRT